MKTLPLKFRDFPDGKMLFADDAGSFFQSDERFLERYVGDRLGIRDQRFLRDNGHVFDDEGDLSYTGFAYRWAARHFVAAETKYLILVPTLRCNLACDYCQVSRVNETARGFDWSDETVEAVLRYLSELCTKEIKIEFQGGEPLLRLDLLERVRTFCRDHFETAHFVVCTNMQAVNADGWSFLSSDDTFISTSFDGTLALHEKQRTKSGAATSVFLENLKEAIRRYGSEKVSALPTLDPDCLPDPDDVIGAFAGLGLRSIYLRPINHQGFARKRYGKPSSGGWDSFRNLFIDKLVEHNAASEDAMEEYYFSHCLRRIFRPGQNNHVDLRNPNILGHDYLVIDYDGLFYPTDEARMLTRVGQMDLSIGSLFEGIDDQKLADLNANSSNDFDPDCMHCVYQPYCGVDLIDDLSRYGRVDLPRHLTDFCNRHLSIFDKAFSMIYSQDRKVQKSLAIWLGIANFEQALAPAHQ